MIEELSDNLEDEETDNDAEEPRDPLVAPTLHQRVTNIEKVLRKLLHEVQDLGIELILN